MNAAPGNNASTIDPAFACDSPHVRASSRCIESTDSRPKHTATARPNQSCQPNTA